MGRSPRRHPGALSRAARGALIALCLAPAVAAAAPPSADLARALAAYVHPDGVDYAGLRAHPADLDAYLRRVAGPLPKFRSPDDQKGFFIDVYNACVLSLIVTHPEAKTIQDIGEPFKIVFCRVGGRARSLNDIEDNELRHLTRKDARIHAALVCASRGCPDLEPTPWQAPGLDERLTRAARKFLSEPAHARIDDAGKAIFVSQLFAPDWLAGDFVAQSGSVPAWLKQYGPPALGRALDAGYRIEIVPWDWTLNARR